MEAIGETFAKNVVLYLIAIPKWITNETCLNMKNKSIKNGLEQYMSEWILSKKTVKESLCRYST